MNEQLQVIDVQSVAVAGVSPQAAAFAAEQLGPMPGNWDGYDQLDENTSQELYGKVGYIHGLSAEAGRQIIAVGQTLLEMKEMLPHGQFMACVAAEFGWSREWANQLMQVGERFSNVNSSGHLPSSAKVLALLAASDADDATGDMGLPTGKRPTAGGLHGAAGATGGVRCAADAPVNVECAGAARHALRGRWLRGC
jgi:hypothetical protein